MELHLAEPGDGWERGDQLVIASTDFDMEQAEQVISSIVNNQVHVVVTKVVVERCEGFICTVWGEVGFQHFGERFKGVDMRAEVGLITRNIKVPSDRNNCCMLTTSL